VKLREERLSQVKEIRDDLISKVQAVLPGIPVAKWAGEEKAFDATKPGIYVHWSGGITHPSDEIGDAVCQLDTIFELYFATEDLDGGEDGDDQAADYMETVRNALSEVTTIHLGIIRAFKDPVLGGRTEMAVKIHAGCYLYAQGWRVEQVTGSE
jgi:hypothetical protein